MQRADRTDLSRTTKRIRRILDLLTGSDDAPRSLMDDLKDLERRRSELQADLQESADVEPLYHSNLAEIYRWKVADLGQLLEDPATKNQAFDLMRSLIEVIRLVPENGELRVELRGELAGILALCGDMQKARPFRIRLLLVDN